MVCFIFFPNLYVIYACSFKNGFVGFVSFCHRMKGLWNGFSLSIQHRASEAFRWRFNIRAIAGSYCECDRFAIAPVSFCFVVVASVT